ncbi:MAG: BrnA antitoxin family protein [Synergistaceae bacterium]|jgi:uncharacterized protein (DUF4415 family)|nr:BrnA antitoxin family protein [Synergistaceae bacterium]
MKPESDGYTKADIEKMSSATDWERVLSMKDADIITDEDCPDVTELIAQGKTKTIRMGRPRKETPKELVSIRIDARALNALRATGNGWQTRLSEHIAEWAAKL